MSKKMFEPNWRDLPNGWLTTTRKGKRVYRFRLNEDELIAKLEAGQVNICIDVLADNKGEPIIRTSYDKQKRVVKRMPFYAWALPKKEKV